MQSTKIVIEPSREEFRRIVMAHTIADIQDLLDEYEIGRQIVHLQIRIPEDAHYKMGHNGKVVIRIEPPVLGGILGPKLHRSLYRF